MMKNYQASIIYLVKKIQNQERLERIYNLVRYLYLKGEIIKGSTDKDRV